MRNAIGPHQRFRWLHLLRNDFDEWMISHVLSLRMGLAVKLVAAILIAPHDLRYDPLLLASAPILSFITFKPRASFLRHRYT